MIESIEICDVATYVEAQSLTGLSKFNFIYGSNGSGKTTVSRVIADEGAYHSCRVKWKSGAKMQAMVYNRDFVERNFGPSTELKGIFTLGEKNAETLDKLAAAKTDLDKFGKSISELTEVRDGTDGLGGKRGELTKVEDDFRDACWAQKKKHEKTLKKAFEGVLNSSENFKLRVLREKLSNNAPLRQLDELEAHAKTVFGPTSLTELSVPIVSGSNLLAHESNEILKKRVLGKQDVDIADMIRKLGNSDWVRQGRAFYEVNDSTCPFCQQRTDDAFGKSLEDYFDQTFLNDSAAIDDLTADYAVDAERFQAQLAVILSNPSKFLNSDALRIEAELVDSRIMVNKQLLAQKQREPSRVIELEPMGPVLGTISTLIAEANKAVATHNKTVTNIAQEKQDLISQSWRYILDVELKASLQDYETKRQGLTKAIDAIGKRIDEATDSQKLKVKEIAELEKQSTSIQPTVDAINSLLTSFGFRGFTLAKAQSGNCYTLRRGNGSDAKDTLSEGERTFVTFLYFIHLLKGSESESGMTSDRVVVFDDPVSSLDSDVLFIVASLIKGVLQEVRDGKGHVKQVFVLTHNVYFHKEVTFNARRNDREAMRGEETFWVVRKSGAKSKIESHSKNPISTSYELLWTEVRQSGRTNLSIQNTLRRILENYFKILGRIDPDEICDKFEGGERLMCRSLFSWVNDGSHFAHDDLYIAIDESMVERYLIIFRAIFDRSGHGAHYKMMMGDAYIDQPTAALVDETKGASKTA
ncbi:AAA family ATPase [Paraburkholderia sp. 5N]|uniref:AAA family ATPase n=2 Tax=Paraburkholderia elongata TaxID=2675747 RepID=A0A972NPB4_9BURK|nr:AAA family ATPase [Paraburkholderia elongata]